jgi:hypothetical protein
MSLYSPISPFNETQDQCFWGEPTGYAPNTTTEERKLMSMTGSLRERNQ